MGRGVWYFLGTRYVSLASQGLCEVITLHQSVRKQLMLASNLYPSAAACGIYGIRNAGLAICVGTWSSCQVVTSFIFGILIFKEEVKNVYHTGFAFMTLAVGLVGMSTYSKPQKLGKKPRGDDDADLEDEERTLTTRKPTVVDSTLRQSHETEGLVVDYSDSRGVIDKGRIAFGCGRISLTKRQLGIVGAIINGLWGGLNLIPLHFAQKEGFGGAAYLVSYACGSMIVNTCMWIIYFLYLLHQRRYNFQEAVKSLPDFHLDSLWGPGFLAGSLYSVANFGSILAVTYLGQGVGFSLCQVQILVSGLWGIFFFKEIKGRETITKWVISACITVSGILFLTYEKAH